MQPAVGPQSQAAPAGAATAPQYRSNPVAFRRPDVLAGLLLLLAGVAAGVSLVLDWLPDGRTGTDLVRTGVDQVRTSFSDVVDSGFWQPLLVVLGGGALALLGLLMFLPARRHRLLGLLALLVAGGVVAAVLVPLVQERFRMDTFDLGFYVAIAVAVLGLLGALKALLTGPKYATAGPT
ncbi:hypothetical protein GB931_20540 [Modestobacter sp. I12A-02628]|uniref:Uncharacterized protein n=1 Tax=Goekera deserti TaxID=2497753 RepID=A0A7K3W896_9ACTN|nr:hypothetical protein [Goekera deserti]NDI49435.1 hypothetical protein [Goekera deserti]NEL52691.1 hypothetical protein [Goekera deserti]